eukprot:SAG31_NODE_149_length_22476_cov_41.827189_1_plen_155_part_00
MHRTALNVNTPLSIGIPFLPPALLADAVGMQPYSCATQIPAMQPTNELATSQPHPTRTIRLMHAYRCVRAHRFWVHSETNGTSALGGAPGRVQGCFQRRKRYGSETQRRQTRSGRFVYNDTQRPCHEVSSRARVRRTITTALPIICICFDAVRW